MAGGAISTIIGQLRRLVRTEDADSDGRLLERFDRQRDESAFETLLRRHGPMVLAVCRRVLNDAHEAEDAFQATFLVLARRARAVRKREAVGSWLHGVAYRCALKARTTAARAAAVRRRISESDMSIEQAESDATWRELRPLLDAELDRLPEKYRQPLVLCYLEGKTKEEAARILGWPEGTVSGRLHRAKELLRSRLDRRGLTLSVAGLSAAIASDAAAAVPATLFETTHRAALAFAAGRAAGAVATPVATLAEGVIQTMMWTKLRMIAVALVALALLTSSGFVAVNKLTARQGTEASVAQAVAGNAETPPAAKPESDQERLQGDWEVVKTEVFGKDAPEGEVTKGVWTFRGEKLLTKSLQGTVIQSEVKLDEKAKPKTLDVTPIDGPEGEKGKTFKGIYELTGDDLRLCMAGPGLDRPTELKTKEGVHILLFTLKRVKKEKPETPAAANRDAEKRGERRTKDPLASAARIKALLEEKKEAAQVSFDGRMQEFQAGRARVDVLCEASRRLTEAQVQTSTSESERLKAMEAHVERAKQMENIANNRFATGSVNIMDYMDLKLHRIEAEITLEKEKAKAK